MGCGASSFASISFVDTVDDLEGIGYNANIGSLQLGFSDEGVSSVGVSKGKSVGSNFSFEAGETETIFKFNFVEEVKNFWQGVKSVFEGWI